MKKISSVIMLALVFTFIITIFTGCKKGELEGAIDMERVPLLNSNGQTVGETYRYTGKSFKTREKLVLKLTNESDVDIVYFELLTNVTYDSNTNGYDGTGVAGFFDGDIEYMYKEGTGEPYTVPEDAFEMCVETKGFYFKYWVQIYNSNKELVSGYRSGYGEVYNDDEEFAVKPGETYYFVVHFAVDIQADIIFTSRSISI